MKKSEVLTKYAKEITEAMVRCYDAVLDSAGRLQYPVYIWSDGEIRTLEQVQGDATRLVPNESETRELYYVTTVAEAVGFDPWDVVFDGKPDDPAEAEAMEAEIMAFLREHYRNNVEMELDDIIDRVRIMDE